MEIRQTHATRECPECYGTMWLRLGVGECTSCGYTEDPPAALLPAETSSADEPEGKPWPSAADEQGGQPVFTRMYGVTDKGSDEFWTPEMLKVVVGCSLDLFVLFCVLYKNWFDGY